MTELNVFEDAASGYIVFENEGRIVKATPQQAMGLMVSLARRFGYELVQARPEQKQNLIPKKEEQIKQPIEVAQEETEQEQTNEDSDEEGDEEVEELFEETQPAPQPQKVAVKKPNTPPNPPPPSTRPLNVAKQVEAKMLAQRSPGRVGKSF